MNTIIAQKDDTCDKCGKEIPKGEHIYESKYDGDYICEECFDEQEEWGDFSNVH